MISRISERERERVGLSQVEHLFHFISDFAGLFAVVVSDRQAERGSREGGYPASKTEEAPEPTVIACIMAMTCYYPDYQLSIIFQRVHEAIVAAEA